MHMIHRQASNTSGAFVGNNIVDHSDITFFSRYLNQSWWLHQMVTFSALLAIFAGISPVTDEFLAQRPVKRSFDVFFDLRLNEWLSKQSWGWWFGTPSRPVMLLP